MKARLLRFLQRALVPAALALACVVVHMAFRHPFHSGDSGVVARSARPIVACLKAGQFRACPNVSYFPPAQLLVGALAAWATFNDDEVYALLGEVNLALFAWVLWATARFLRERAPGREWLGLVFLVGSYALNYAVTSFGEMVGVALGVAMVVAAQRGQAVRAGLAALALGLTKDVAAPLAVALGVAALPILADETWRAWLRRSWRSVGLVTGLALAGGGASLAFNVFRYGTITNTYLLDGKLRVHTVAQQALHVVAIFFSPAGGLVVVAPLGLVALVVAAVRGARAWRTPASVQRWWPLVFTVLVSVGLATWFTPLGWWAWGARLSLPWLVPAVVLALAVAPPGALEGRWRWAVLGVTPLAVLNAAHLAAPEPMFRYFEQHICSQELGSDAFFACITPQVFDVGGGLAAWVASKALVQPMVQVVVVVHLVVLAGLLTRWLRPADGQG